MRTHTKPPEILRARALDAVSGARVVVAAAPYGYGKTTFARQLTASCGFPDPFVIDARSDPAFHARALAALEEGAAVIVDDLEPGVDSAATAALVRTALDGGHSDLRLVLCTRDIAALGPALGSVDAIRARSTGALAVIGAHELRLDDLELDELAPAVGAADLVARHGRWPLGSVLATGGALGMDDRTICEGLFAAAPTDVARLLARLAPLRTVPVDVVAAAAGRSALDGLAAWTWDLSPAFASLIDGNVRFTEPLSDTCSHHGDGPQQATAFAETAALAALTGGGVRTVRNWLVEIPTELMSPTLELVNASAGAALADVTPHDLQATHDRIWASAPELGPWASGILSWAMVSLGHARFGPVALTTLTRMLGKVPEPGRSGAALTALEPFNLQWASQLCMSLVWVMLHSRQRESRHQAALLWQDVEMALARNGLAKESVHAFFLATDCLTGGRAPDDAAALVLPSTDATDDPLALLATFCIGAHSIRCGDHAGARAALARVERWAGAFPEVAGDGTHVGALLRMQRCCVDLCDPDADHAEIAAVMESLWPALVSAPIRTSTMAAPLFATCWLDAGRTDLARRWWRRAADRPADLPLAREDVQAIEARIQIRSGDTRGAATMAAMIEERRSTGHLGAAAILLRWLVADLASVGELDLARDQLQAHADCLPPAWSSALEDLLPSAAPESAQAGSDAGNVAPEPAGPVRLVLLGPEVRIRREDLTTEAVPGKAGLLLAALVAAGGSIELDRAVDLLYPDLDVAAGRKRLHSTFHRIRRAFGASGSGLIGLDDGVVRLREGPGLVVDVWEFERAIRGGHLAEALVLYGDDFCSRQLAYEDVAIETRRALRNRFARAAIQVLGDRLAAGDLGESTAELARKAWGVVPDDEDVCRAAVMVLHGGGAAREAREMAEQTTRRLADLGIEAGSLLPLR